MTAIALTTAPPGYPKDHTRIELLRMKGMLTWKHWPVEPWLGTAEAKDGVIAVLRASASRTEGLDDHVGASEPERSHRADRVMEAVVRFRRYGRHLCLHRPEQS